MKLLIRADANSEIGLGHVMRCLALAQACQDSGGAAEFLCASLPPAVDERLRSEGFPVRRIDVVVGSSADAAATVEAARESSATWVAADGYALDAEFQSSMKGSGARLLVIDDMAHLAAYEADLVLNQNPQATDAIYAHRAAGTDLLLGSRYAMLRREFCAWRDCPRKPAPVRRLLVTLGGADPANVTLKVIQAIRQLETQAIEVIVLVGPANPHRAELVDAVRGSNRAIELKESASNMPELMNWADCAIAAAGSTCWELAFMGVPNLLIVLAENQSGGAEAMQRLNASRNLGWHADLQPEAIAMELEQLLGAKEVRDKMSDCGRALIDGRGAARVIAELGKRTSYLPGTRHRSPELPSRETDRPDALQLRLANAGDAGTLWRWANDPEVRACAFSQGQIAWEDHVKWLTAKLQDPDCFILLASDAADRLVGQIRFDIRGGEAWIGVSVSAAMRGRGLASELIRRGMAHAAEGRPSLEVFRAEIKAFNARSLRAFQRAGFVRLGETTHGDDVVVQLACHR